jgi:hypothetical protein
MCNATSQDLRLTAHQVIVFNDQYVFAACHRPVSPPSPGSSPHDCCMLYIRNSHGLRLPWPDTACLRVRKMGLHFKAVGMRRSGNSELQMLLHQNISIIVKLQLSFPMYPSHDW